MGHFDLTGITNITQDSRAVKPGALFVALKGTKIDGVQFIPQAEEHGAIAVLVANDVVIPPTRMRIIRSIEPRLALSQIAAQFYPAQPEHLVAVTGTDGKTSTADFFRQLTHLCGKKSAYIGTLGTLGGDDKILHAATHTTPGAVELHHILSELAEHNINYACLEASSHGLDQYRLHGANLQAAAFTNIARDHLDYHETEQMYFEAKTKLFSEVLPEGGVAVINADDKHAGDLRKVCSARNHTVMDFGRHASALKLLSLAPTPHGQGMKCELLGKQYDVQIPLVGAFQAMNILAAIGLAHATGIAIDDLVNEIPKLKGVPGRLELAAKRDNGAAVYVDYAHTPAALANILNTLRPHTKNKLHVVFGCGGNRDAGKRPEMGRIACELADRVIVTDDNPRNENPAHIREAIMLACKEALEVPDRVTAIYAAVHALDSGDILIIAGKGHEKTQIIGNVEHPHDDVMVAKEAAGNK